MDDYVVSDSGVKVWTTPEAHPLLRQTDTTHPSFLDKLAETYSRGRVSGRPRECSARIPKMRVPGTASVHC